MSQLRKLQTEIEKTLKKVAEGLGIFDDFWDQLQVTDNQNNRDKLETQLKTEIKKLQRFRDQIKTWAANNEIKDKTDLLNARKDIERRMERFKAVEKEAKTKAFSKEGLGAASRLDPRERQRAEMRDWLNNTVESLNTQLEEFDAELESMAGQKSKKGAKPPARVGHLEESIVRHRQHVMRLEQLLRLLDNDAIGPDEVDGIKDLVDDYLDRNQEEFDEFSSPDDMYGELLEQMENMADSVVAAPPSHSKAARDKEAKLEKEREERERERQKAAAAAVKAQLAAQGNTRLAVEVDEPAKPAAAAPAPPVTVVRTTSGSAAAAAAVAPPAGGPVGPPPPPPPSTQPPPPPPPASRAAGTEPVSPAAMQLASSMAAMLAPPDASSAPSTPVRTGLGQLSPSGTPIAADAAAAAAAAAGAIPPPPPPSSRTGVPQSPQVYADGSAFPALGGAPQTNGLKPGGPSAAAVVAANVQKRPVGPAPSGTAGATPRPAADGSSEEAARAPDGSMDVLTAQLRLMGIQDSGPSLTPAQSLQVLQATAARSIPQPADAQWQSVPQRVRLPPVQPPASYPTQRLPIFDSPALYEKLDAETLFFIFYNQPGSHQQYLAARELKRQAWRYHKQLGAWFQRHEEPKAGGQPGDDWEQGTYVYFDALLHEEPAAAGGTAPAQASGWCYRLKQDFLFQYSSLEDDMV